ncbi:uncharacterized protein LOC134821131 [Bolinopsis microptera]|uniref:uncharacterized protein LOC134821131 n=1 Tax=Bolinopsis microptera TaxID=2820187 RepID=UPI003079D75F
MIKRRVTSRNYEDSRTECEMRQMERKHVMLSYQWDSQEIVLRVYNSLTSLGYRVWMDIMGGISGGNIFASMAQSIEKSSALVCFMTEGYERSSNGEKELTYADNTSVRIIPCLLQERVGGGEPYKPTGWLGFLRSNLLYVDFTKAESDEEVYDKAIEDLVKQMNFYMIIPNITGTEAQERILNSSSSPTADFQTADFPTAIISNPLLSHFTQERDPTCTGPMTALRLSIESIPQHIVRQVRRQFSRSRSGSDSVSSNSAGGGGEIRDQSDSGSSLSTVSEPSLDEQYSHLGSAPP